MLASEPPNTLPSSLESSATWQNHGWAVARLYRASFLRDPDTDGMAYWTGRTWQGASLGSVASSFAGSGEFTRRYGALDNGGLRRPRRIRTCSPVRPIAPAGRTGSNA